MTIQTTPIRTKQEYLQLVPALSEEEFKRLKDNIQKVGKIVNPVIINKDNIILDGHNRFKACKELGIPLRTIRQDFDDELDEMIFVIETNLYRRHLNEFQKSEMGKSLEGIESRKAQKRQDDTKFKPGHTSKKHIRSPPWSPSREGDRLEPKKSIWKGTSQEIAKRIGVSHATYERSKKIIEKGSEEQKNLLRKGDVGIRKIYGQIKREEKRHDLIHKAVLERQQFKQQPTIAAKPADGSIRLFKNDFRKLTEEEVRPESVDLIFTDPPYDYESLPLYQDLARLGSKWLKEGGCLITYCGQYAIPTIFDYMQSNNLQYWWIICVKHGGGKVRMHNQRLWVRWKPLLWFVKGPKGTRPEYQIDDIEDFIQSKPAEGEKAEHEWEQSTVEASYMIKNLTVENQVVMDPMLGIATTGVAAVRLKRRFVGCEIDQTYYNTAQDRIRMALMK